MGILQTTKNMELLITRVYVSRLAPEQHVFVVHASKYLDGTGAEQVEIYGPEKCVSFKKELYDQYAALEGLPAFTAPADHSADAFDTYATSLLYPFIEWLLANGHANLG